MKSLDSFPRVSLGVLPTPMYRLENTSRILGVNIWIKRDDMTGVALGGNKVRKLEFLLADALNKGAKVVMTTGGAQSNHAMLTAACALKLGLTPVLVLKKKGVTACKGNQLLNHLMGVDVRFIDTPSYDVIYREMDVIGKGYGKPYYKIPCGGSNALGALGYVSCMKEVADAGVRFDHIVCAEGSGGTHAGCALGAKLFMPGTVVDGMMVDTDPFDEITPAIMRECAGLLEVDANITAADVHLRDMCGPGYAIASEEGNEAVRYMCRNEGIFLDPVYSGKAFAGLMAMAREGAFRPDDNVLFLHTGGAGGLFAIDMD